MSKAITDVFYTAFKTALPLTSSPLVQCITNEITVESMANALLYIDAKPVMADDQREFPEFFAQSDALLLNLGHIPKCASRIYWPLASLRRPPTSQR